MKFIVTLLICGVLVLGTTILGIDFNFKNIDTGAAVTYELILGCVITYFVLWRFVRKYAVISDLESANSKD